MNIYALYVGKGNDLGKLFDPILCLLHGLERLAEHIENIRGGGCRDQTFRIGFNGLAERLVGICEVLLVGKSRSVPEVSPEPAAAAD